MRIYCMSDIHGCMAEFEDALALVRDHLDEPDTMLCLLGDYIHGGADGYAVLDKIMNLQKEYGSDKVVALMGNHEEFVLLGDSSINRLIGVFDDDADDVRKCDDDRYIRWIENLPRYFTEGNTIFVHAGIDEEAGDMWEWMTSEDTYVNKYPAETGKIEGLDMKVVAGHVGTAEISGIQDFMIFTMMANHTITLMERCWTAALSQSFWSIQTRTNITKSQSLVNGLYNHLLLSSFP